MDHAKYNAIFLFGKGKFTYGGCFRISGAIDECGDLFNALVLRQIHKPVVFLDVVDNEIHNMYYLQSFRNTWESADGIECHLDVSACPLYHDTTQYDLLIDREQIRTVSKSVNDVIRYVNITGQSLKNMLSI